MESPINRNQKMILTLLYFSLGPVEQFKRLKLSVYGLGEELRRYKFNGKCYWGPDDLEFREDLGLLGFYLEKNSIKPPDEPAHMVYDLTEYGCREAKKFIREELKPEEIKKIMEVALDLGKDPKDMPVSKLYEKYVVET